MRAENAQFAVKYDLNATVNPQLLVRLKMSSNTPTTSTMSSTASKTTGAKKVAKKSDAPVAAAAPAPVAAPAPAAAATPAKRGPKKAAETAAAVAAPVAAAAPAPTPVDATAPVAAAPAGPQTTLEEDFRGVVGHLSTLKETLSALQGEVKRLEKRVNRDLKDARKRRRRNRAAEGADGETKPTRPSIFEIPNQLTDELNVFLGNPKGTQMTRSAVTKAITAYVKQHNLKNKHDINPDAKLRKLLDVDEKTQLSYFNLQRYLNKHYVKVPKATATATA